MTRRRATRYWLGLGRVSSVTDTVCYRRTHCQVDKDVAVAKEHFGLSADYNAMSPLVLYKGYTKDFLNGKV